LLSATEGAKALLENRIWPLWKNTRCKNIVRPGHQVLIYLAGPESDCGKVFASARVQDVIDWSDRKHRPIYPLMLEGEPHKTLILERRSYFQYPIAVAEQLDQLSFIPANKKKWGVAMMGGMRSLSASDYEVLSEK